MKDVVILFAGRFPSEKAASLFVDLNARSLVETGARVTVLAPRRLGRGTIGKTPYALKYLPTIDLSRIPLLWSIANFVTVWVFTKWAFMWLLVYSRREDVIISNDAWPLLVASLIRRNTMFEMHDFAKDTWMYRTLLKRVRYVLVTNEWKRGELSKQFGVPVTKTLFERNAVDTTVFGAHTRTDARRTLGLDPNIKIALYTGHLYEWKGADTFARAAASLKDVQCVFVGGSPADVERFTLAWGGVPNIRIVGHVDHAQVPLWQSAADVLVLPNSGKEEISIHYTSPMKLFEYMASDRPVVASDLPSIREVLADTGTYAISDDPASLAAAIEAALTDPSSLARAAAARERAQEFTWRKRAARIMAEIS